MAEKTKARDKGKQSGLMLDGIDLLKITAAQIKIELEADQNNQEQSLDAEQNQMPSPDSKHDNGEDTGRSQVINVEPKQICDFFSVNSPKTLPNALNGHFEAL